MKKHSFIAGALVAMAATGLALPSNTASAADGNGESICSNSNGEFNVGVMVVELQRMVGYNGDRNPGTPNPFLPRYAQLCNPNYDL